MKVILREDVHNLGKSGELVDVKPGFGRNYLLPRKLAVLANEKNVRQLEHEKRGHLRAPGQAARATPRSRPRSISAVSVKIARKVGEQDKLFGSVTALDIAEALAAKGQKVDRRHIHLPEPIKTRGRYEVEIRLHRDVTAKIKVEVVAEA